MMVNMRNKTSYSTVLGLLLVCLFAVCMLFTLAYGATIYKDISSVMDSQYGTRTVLSYVVTKVRHYDVAGSVELGSLDGMDAIILREEIDDEKYLTYIYAYDGSLCELFCPAYLELTLDSGEQIISLDELEFSLSDSGNLLEIKVSLGDDTARQTLYIRSGKAVA